MLCFFLSNKGKNLTTFLFFFLILKPNQTKPSVKLNQELTKMIPREREKMGGEYGMEVMCLWITSFHGYDLDTMSTFYITKKKKFSSDWKQNPLLYMKLLALPHKEKKHSIDFKTQYFQTNSILGSSLKTK